MMNKIKFLSLFLLIILAITSCQDNILDTNIDPVNDNDPTLDGTVSTVSGMESFAKGVYNHTVDPVNNGVFFWFTYGFHETMGDVLTMPWGNFGGRWVNQTESIVLDDGTVVTPPSGGPQPGEIAVRNTRAAGSDNMTQYEWVDMYGIIGQCNIILENIENIQGATASQQDAFKAWALWWKAYAYHRIGSMYEVGVIVNTPGEVNNNFVENDAIIAESNRLLGDLETLLGGVANTGEFNTIFANAQIEITGTNVDIVGLQENINTLKARNMVYNTKVADMTSADWTQVLNWANAGVSSNANAFTMKSENTLLDNAWLPGIVTGFWYFPSDRLIQDINEGDARKEAYFVQDAENGFPFPNPRGRGIQYGASYFWKDESAIVSSTPNAVTMYYAGSYEENKLLLAEAKIRTGNIEGGLADLDAIRNFQNAGLAATAGSGMNEVQALEEVRKERRLALIFRGVNFYDARRYGISSGSRTGAWILDAAGNLNTNATINYGYLDYWPVPAFETDFNPLPSNPN